MDDQQMVDFIVDYVKSRGGEADLEAAVDTDDFPKPPSATDWNNRAIELAQEGVVLKVRGNGDVFYIPNRPETVRAKNVTNYHGDVIQSSKFRDFKPTISNAPNQPTQKENTSKLMTFINKFWWMFIIPLCVVLIGIAIENDWFNISGTK